MANEKPIKRARNTFSDVLNGNLPHGTPKPIVIKKNEPKKIKSIFRYDQKIDMSHKKDDAKNVMQKTFSHNLKEIEMYQTEKLEEDITVVNIPNLGDVDILTLMDLIKDTLEQISEIIDISSLCRKGLTEFLPYGTMRMEESKSSIEDAKKLADTASKKDTGGPAANRTDEEIKGTAEADIMPDVQSGADKPKYVDQESPKPLCTEQRRGTVGMKRPPASSIAMAESRKAEKTDAQPDEPVLQNSLGQNSVPKKHGKNFSENIGNYDANNRTEKKYKKIIIPSTPVSEDPYGYSTPTELEIMAEKARNNIITEAQYIEYEKKYFAENFSETAAEINYSSDSPDHTDQDMDFE
ncbi:hypothetical protein AYI70_g371 [Smittium culicis]|uniref:Uncharacterized protein n=1 Tax=Smittium culicis TaxID=133412 RepID=A0A1R1YH03_9FUNG|nr:hypothetical protein AYI70_g371 [Smittium culicis]